MDLQKIKMDYGYKKAGQSHFVFVAPHAGGDDLQTGKIARMLARKLKGFYIINNKFFKATNSRANQTPEQVEDFNKLYWSSKKKKYLWKRKNPAMKIFFKDVADFCDQAKNFSQENKAVAVYIHGMVSEKNFLDIGVGLKAKNGGRNKFIGSSRSDYYCSGVPTVPISKLKELYDLLIKEKKQFVDFLVSIGELYPAWSKRIAIQFHKECGRNDFAVQLEINNKFKKDDIMRKKIVQVLTKTLLTTFK